MSAITSVTGRGIPVRGNDIDTDRIIPARFLRCVTFDDLGEHAFEDDRAQLKERGETHPFDDERFQGASVLVVNANFGCGSSREHAPQALMRWGINAIVGVSYSEIFYGNCVALGIPVLHVSPADADAAQTWIAANPQGDLTVDITAQTLTYGDASVPATLPAGAHQQFLDGTWDATGTLMAGLEDVRAKAATLPYVSGY